MLPFSKNDLSDMNIWALYGVDTALYIIFYYYSHFHDGVDTALYVILMF